MLTAKGTAHPWGGTAVGQGSPPQTQHSFPQTQQDPAALMYKAVSPGIQKKKKKITIKQCCVCVCVSGGVLGSALPTPAPGCAAGWLISITHRSTPFISTLQALRGQVLPR